MIGAAAILLHPAVIDVSAWWGQYESIYLLSALAAAILAINGRNDWAAAALAVSLMTKPQALPFLVAFGAWFWATGGWRGVVRAAAIGGAVTVVLWLPFLGAGGPADYLRNLGQYQGEVFNLLSLRAWNPWWIIQEAQGGGFIADNVPIAGPISLRLVGYAVAALLEFAVLRSLLRDPRPRTFLMALAGSALVAFVSLTTMHERYAYGALIFLTPLISEPRLRWLWAAFGLVFTLNLLAAVPPSPGIAAWLSPGGWLGIIGSVAMTAIAGAALASIMSFRSDRAST
jgi:Gpi18-like mannosyltransferase